MAPNDGSPSTPARTASIKRSTNETTIAIDLSLDGGKVHLDEETVPTKVDSLHASQGSASQLISIDTGIGFLDHMIHALAKHAGWTLGVYCRGDLKST